MSQDQACPKLLIFSDLPIREDVRARVSEQFERFQSGEASVLLLEPGFSVFQIVNGEWVFLWGEPRLSVRVEQPGEDIVPNRLDAILEALQLLTLKLHSDIPKAFAEADWQFKADLP